MLSLAGKIELETGEAADLLLDYPATTLVIFDNGPSSGPNEIGPPEIGRLIVIEPLSQKVATTLLSVGSSAPWHLLPADARLEDADPEERLYWDAAQLFDFFTALPNLGNAIASKLLHLKRPAFFPILDKVVRELYSGAAKTAYDNSQRAKVEAPNAHKLYWSAIRQDLLIDENRRAIDEIRATLRADSRRNQAAHLASLSTVRLIDMLAWQKRS